VSRTTVPEDVFVGARLSRLSYVRAEDNAQNRAELKAGAQLHGFDQVVLCENTHGLNDAQAVVFINTHTKEAWVAYRGSEGGPPSREKIARVLRDNLAHPNANHRSEDDANVKDWLTNSRFLPTTRPAAYGPHTQVHSGFDASVDSIYPDVRRALDANGVRTVRVTGHSQGAGDAQLAAPRLASDGYKVAGVYLYEPPAVSEGPALAERYKHLGVTNVCRVENKNDAVSRLASGVSFTPERLAGDALNSGQRVSDGIDMASKAFDPYGTSVGGRDPVQPQRGGVGTYLYIDSGNNVRVNPPGHEVVQDRAKVTFTEGAGSLTDTHFGFERAMFRHLPEETQQAWLQKLAETVGTAERRLYEARYDGTPPDHRNELEATWNAGKREDRALVDPPVRDGRRLREDEWFWESKHDRRDQCSFQIEKTTRPTRSGGTSEAVTATCHLAAPGGTIDWSLDTDFTRRSYAGRHPVPSGGNTLIDFRFGADPADRANYTAKFPDDRVWKQLNEQLSQLTKDEKLAPLTMTVTQESQIDRMGRRLDGPPQVTVTDQYGRFVSVPIEQRRSVDGRDVPEVRQVMLNGYAVPTGETAAHAVRGPAPAPPASQAEQTTERPHAPIPKEHRGPRI
jgi:hypothetical protein